MLFVACSVRERSVNPLFELFDGGDFVLTSWRDVEKPLAEVRIYLPDPSRADEAKAALRAALDAAGETAAIETGEIADEDWRFSYRRHFTAEEIGRRLVTVPAWEKIPGNGRIPIVLDPGLAFGTGKHETTKACLEYIDALAPETPGAASFLDMGCGSGILSIAAAKLGFSPVHGFDVDPEAVKASKDNAAANGAAATFRRHALGAGRPCPAKPADLAVANILGPLLVRFAPEIAPLAKKDLVVSGILTEIYPEVAAEYAKRGFVEVSRRTIGEWTTGHLRRAAPDKDSAP